MLKVHNKDQPKSLPFRYQFSRRPMIFHVLRLIEGFPWFSFNNLTRLAFTKGMNEI